MKTNKQTITIGVICVAVAFLIGYVTKTDIMGTYILTLVY